jgi:dihydropteroate synthase
MIPDDGGAQVLVLRELDEVRTAMSQARVSSAGVDIMENKGLFRVVRVTGLDVRAANILKQEMLSGGGEVATSRDVYQMSAEQADCLVMGTMVQFERLMPKLYEQPFGLRRLARSMEAALRNYDTLIPSCHAGLDLSESPLVMGVVNVTPDSFSDGGLLADAEMAVQAGMKMVQEGAALVDVGGESTRPGADTLPLETERERVLPVVRTLAAALPGRVSIDTYKAALAAEALAAGAYMVNDISALRMDPAMVSVLRDADCPVILMHMLGEPKTMQQAPTYSDVVREIYEFFLERLSWAVDNGLKEENLLVDPGIGFGKTTAHNLEILRNLAAFRSLGRPIVVGASRKRFLGQILDIEEPRARDEGTAATTVIAAAAGAHIVRAHRVGLNRDAVKVARAVLAPLSD